MSGNTIYTTSENDVLDAICFAHYGKTSGVVEKVLDVNRGLCEYGPFIPAGVEIVLPEFSINEIDLNAGVVAFFS